MEGAALSYNRNYIQVYSNSWGPNDDGATVAGPKGLASQALAEGVKYGRNGLGSIFVWAAGNGGRHDNCNCDGYANSLFTITIGSVSSYNSIPYYAEPCAKVLAVTYSSGGVPDRRIVTTGVSGTCVDYHSGTSAAAPLAAGIIGLVLSVKYV